MFEEIELKIVENLRLQLQKNPENQVLNPQNWLIQKLKNLDNFRQNNLKIMQDYKPISATRQILQASFQNSINQTNNFMNLQNSPNFFGIDTTRINNLIDSITTIERHSETAILRMTDDVYRRTLHLAELEMASGTNLETAIDMATKSFLEQGINCIVYKDGRHINIANYVRMALRTASMKATLHGRSERFSQLGYDTVLISQYDRCLDTCLPWQGRVYIEDTFIFWNGEVKEIGEELWGKSNYCGKWFPLLSTAIEKGLFHPNCRHDMGLYIDGRTKIPKPIDAEKDLENYRIEQHQRALERKIRKAKRLVLGTLDKDTAKAYKRQLRALQSELKQFVSEHNDILKREYGREKIYDGETQNNSQNPLTNSGNSGIIKVAKIPLEQAKKRDHKINITNIAIEKISKTNIPYLSSEQNEKIYEVHKELLKIAQTQNNSNEVAYLFNLNSEETAYQLGQKHEVNIFKNPYALSMANSTRNDTLFLTHNHPSTKDFSYSDIGIFLLNDNFKAISVVSNTGDVHILYKSSNYDFKKAMDYIKSVRSKYDKTLTDEILVKDLLKGFKKVGILQY